RGRSTSSPTTPRRGRPTGCPGCSHCTASRSECFGSPCREFEGFVCSRFPRALLWGGEFLWVSVDAAGTSRAEPAEPFHFLPIGPQDPQLLHFRLPPLHPAFAPPPPQRLPGHLQFVRQVANPPFAPPQQRFIMDLATQAELA